MVFVAIIFGLTKPFVVYETLRRDSNFWCGNMTAEEERDVDGLTTSPCVCLYFLLFNHPQKMKYPIRNTFWNISLDIIRGQARCL
jgi:hypothetical protein